MSPTSPSGSTSTLLLHPNYTPKHQNSADSGWDIVDEQGLRLAMDYVPLASPGSRLVGLSVRSYALWRDETTNTRGDAALAVATKSNIWLYETRRGERAFRFVKVSTTSLRHPSPCSIFHSDRTFTPLCNPVTFHLSNNRFRKFSINHPKHWAFHPGSNSVPPAIPPPSAATHLNKAPPQYAPLNQPPNAASLSSLTKKQAGSASATPSSAKSNYAKAASQTSTTCATPSSSLPHPGYDPAAPVSDTHTKASGYPPSASTSQAHQSTASPPPPTAPPTPECSEA
jgi:hypothetical protein